MERDATVTIMVSFGGILFKSQFFGMLSKLHRFSFNVLMYLFELCAIDSN